MGVRSFEHIGITAVDLKTVVDFFVLLGFQASEPGHVSGAWADRINGLTGTDAQMVFVTPPDGTGAIEISQFASPATLPRGEDLPGNAPGLRHLAYRVDGLEEMLVGIRAAGYEVMGEVVNYQDVWLVCYVRGPEGLIVELGERLDIS